MCNVVPHNFTATLVLNMQRVHFGRLFVLFLFLLKQGPTVLIRQMLNSQADVELTEVHVPLLSQGWD